MIDILTIVISGLAASIGAGSLFTALNNLFLKKGKKTIKLEFQGHKIEVDIRDKEKIMEMIKTLSKPKVFISYSSLNSSFVDKLVNDLKTNDIDVWYDKLELKVGDSIHSMIDKGIDESAYFLIIVSKELNKSKAVNYELKKMIEEEKKSNISRILPIKIDQSELPDELKDKYYADFSENYQNGLDEIISKLKSPAANKV